MARTRAKDWLIGAVGAVLLLAVGVAVLWWVVSEPADAGGTEAAPSPTVGADPADGEPPADLAEEQVWLADLTLDAGTVVTAGSTLRDVRAVGEDVLTDPDGLVAARVAVEATVPFEVVADELGEGTTVRAADDGQATVVRTVEALGRELRATATGTVEVRAGRLVLEPTSIDVGGPGFLSEAIASLVRRLVTIQHEVQGLPPGLELQDVTVQDDGFRTDLQGQDVRLTP